MLERKLKAYKKPCIKCNVEDTEVFPTVLSVGVASAALGGFATAESKAVGIRPESKGEFFLKPVEA